MQDIAPELLERLKKEFDKNVSGSKELTRLRDGILDGTYGYSAVNGYAARLGQALKSAMDTALKSDVLPDGKMYYNIAQRVIEPMLRETFADVTDKAAACINRLNDAAGIGIRAIRPEPEEDRIRGVIDSATGADYYDDVKDKVHSSAENLTQHAADQAVKENAEFQARSGLSPKIIRSGGSNCCDWCAALEGTYRYPDEVPKDVYRRHAHCNCTVEFVPDKSRRQDVHSKVWRSSSEQEESEELKAFSEKQEDWKTPQDRETAAALAESLKTSGVADSRNDYQSIAKGKPQLMQNGFSCFPEGDVLTEYAKNIVPKEDFYDVAMHGNEISVGFGSKKGNMSPRLLAEYIEHRPDYHGENIRLFACLTGKELPANAEYECFAAELATRLGRIIEAPTDMLYINPDGTYYVGYMRDGTMKEFTPNEIGRRR